MWTVTRLMFATAVLSVVACALGSTRTPLLTPGGSPPAPSPTPVSTDDVGSGAWDPMPAVRAFGNASVANAMAMPDGFIATGCTTLPGGPDCDQPAVWHATDAREWSEPTRLPMAAGETAGTARTAVATPVGTVVGGDIRRGDRVHAALWLAVDGRSFERVADDRALDDAMVVAFATVGRRVVAIGAGAFTELAGFRAWASDDGRTWIDTTPGGADQSYPTGVLARADGFVAWGPTCSVCPPSTAWWTSGDGLGWSPTAVDLGGPFSHVTVIGEVEAGLLAFGTAGGGDAPTRPAGWSLPNGADHWETAIAPDAPVPGLVNRFLPVGDGSVLAGTAWGPPEQQGLVWYRGPDERAWRLAARIPGIEVVGLLQDRVTPERLVLIGRDPNAIGQTTLWTGTVDWVP